MRATHLLIGCVFGLGLVATANAATNVDAGSAGAGDCTHSTTADSGSTRDAVVSGGDSAGLAHIAAPTPQASAPAASSRHGDNAMSGSGGSDDAAPSHSHRVSLGWQSLLPGSIQ